jgi:superfamily II DNA or RNA helicase
MKILISHQMELKERDIPPLILKRIKHELTLENPDYQQAVKFGYSLDGKPEFIELFQKDGDRIIIPRGYGGKLLRYLQNSCTEYELVDQRLQLPKVDFHSKIQLRNYQESAVSALVSWRQGGVVAPCGSGKTMIMLEAMARIQQPALWVTHTKELVDQVIARACSAFDITKAEIGIIGAGKFTIGDRLTVALIQTLSKTDLEQIVDKFGAVFIDEAHHLAARSFFYPLGQFPALYRLWVSATPNREDGLTQMVYAAGGSVVHTILQSEVPTVIPKLEVIETNYQCNEDEYVHIIGDLIRDAERNRLIVRTIAGEAGGNYSLVLSDRTEHLDILKAQLHAALPNLNIEILTGSMRKKQREAVMSRVQNREVDILLSTQLAREGLDIKHLNRLFLATPKKAAGAVQQEVGRIMRPEEGKGEAVVYDFWDSRQPILKSQFWKRREVYKKIGMDWQPGRTYQSKSV